MNSLQGYDLKKRYFELFFLKVEKPKARFVRADKSYRVVKLHGAAGKTGAAATTTGEAGTTGAAATTTVHCHMQFSELNERQLTMLLRNVGSGESDEVGKEIKFTSVWLNDQHMLTVHGWRVRTTGPTMSRRG